MIDALVNSKLNYLHYYERTCNLSFFCRISVMVFLQMSFVANQVLCCKLHIYWKLCYSTCNMTSLNTTNDNANPNSASYRKMYYYVLPFMLSTPIARLNSITYI